MQLSRNQRVRLRDALLDAYTRRSDLEKMFYYQLGQNLNAIVAERQGLDDCIFEIIQWAEKTNKLRLLAKGAIISNPDNEGLKRCLLELKLLERKSSARLPPINLEPSQGPATVLSLPPNALFASDQVQIRLDAADVYREEIRVSSYDAAQWKIERKQFAILTVQSQSAGKVGQRYGVRLLIDGSLTPGTIVINRLFAEDRRLMAKQKRNWFVGLAEKVVPVRKAVLKLMVERSNIRDEVGQLRRRSQDLFEERCLLVEHPGIRRTRADSLRKLSIPAAEHGYFNLHELDPALHTLTPDTLLVFTRETELFLFVPYNKCGVDMLILIDASGSMDTTDYIKNNQKHTRLEGVQDALSALIRRRLVVGSRVARLAIMAFGERTAMLYPPARGMAELTHSEQVEEILAQIKQKTQQEFLEQMQVDRGRTNIASALRDGANILNFSGREGNEKVLVLISDGAHWKECTDENRYGEITTTTADPASLADTLHDESDIRIHTIAITDENAYRAYEENLKQGRSNVVVYNTAPNTALLRKIAEATNGIYLESPGMSALQKLFHEIAQGTTHPLM
jgi:hypothetical protein